MNKKNYLFTSESVTEGHPDKVCDQISDAVLDALLEQDPMARVACETAVTTGLVLVMGEITTSAYVDIPKIARHTVQDIGYTRAVGGFDYESCAVLTSIDEQSQDIALGVDRAVESRDGLLSTGAGDQGLMFGFAVDDTPEFMPLPITLAHKLTKRLAEVRKDQLTDMLFPDGKSQVSVRYENGRPVHVDTVVISSQHRASVSLAELTDAIKALVIEPVLERTLFDEKTRILVNPTGRFVIGGPQGDSGLTGRKIICDTYGGMGRHGGGAFSGKDPTKVDRSASYMARYLAKNVVAAGLAKRCEVQLAYAIGVAEPISVSLDCFGTAGVDEKRIEQALIELVDMRPDAIIRHFNLRRPIYRQIANYGHFGRVELGLPWEATDLAAKLKSAAT
ncbi:MAG TPA: methionine adenosyltransferase [Clostridiaceae bacterium]|nr:methionine adenosyltransferase [Clostridiaceae bacterium]